MTARLAVHVTPKAGRDEVAGWRGGELQVMVTAPAEGGRANAAVCIVLARALGVPKSAVRVVRGETSRHKQVAFETLTDDELAESLGRPG